MPKNPSKTPTEFRPAPSAWESKPGAFVFVARHGWLLLIMAVAVYLRATHLDLLEFKADEANAAVLAGKMARLEMFPQIGLTYSVGVKQAPLFIYLLAPFFAISGNPAFYTFAFGMISAGAVWLCYWIGRRFFNVKVGLIAAALFAVSPWAVVFSRKIWPQDFLPVFCSVLLWLWYELLINGRTKHIFWIVFLSLAAWQVHLAATNLIAFGGILWLCCRFPVNWKRVGLGLGLNLLLLLPYIHYQMQRDWEDFRRASAVVDAANQSEVYTVQGIHPQWGFPLPSRNQTGQLVSMISGDEIGDILGLSAQRFLAEYDLVRVMIKLVKLVFVLALLSASVLVVRKARMNTRLPWFDFGQEPRLAVLCMWVITPVVFFGLMGLRTYLSYFALTFPASFLLIGWAIDAGQRYLPTRGLLGRAAIPGLWVVFGVLVVGQFAYTVSLYGFLDREGGARGTYGVIYRHKEALCDRIAAATTTANPILSQDWPPKTPAEMDIQYMVANRLEHRSFPVTAVPPPQVAFVIIDTRFRQPNEPEPAMGVVPRVFGPLRLYEITIKSPASQ